MSRIRGNTRGLKANQLHRLENLQRRRIHPDFLLTPELCKDIALLSFEMQRQIGLMVDRGGKIAFVLVGDSHSILIPDLSDYRMAPGRLRGLRCIHTHLQNEPLTEDDLNDLALLRLDLMAAVTITADGLVHSVHWAHIFPGDPAAHARPYQLRQALRSHQLDIGCLDLIQALEREMGNLRPGLNAGAASEGALLISVTTTVRKKAQESLNELIELSRSCGIEVLDTILQLRKQVDARLLIGRGKLKEMAIRAMQLGATLIIFDQDLNPSQIRSITDQIEIKVIDRTQLILDIFAQRAQSKEGKLQVELAQLKYLLPRLVTKNTAMSRLTGGIGGRGPGETKLEINRRRVRERIHNLENALKLVQKQRKQQRRQREQKRLPVISIIGYTNAGKSTLLNTMTQSHVLAESRLFATLDTSSRRLRFPREMEVIITDTVGFIRNLPKDLMVAFRATLEELENADVLLHVIDISNPRFTQQIQSVEAILDELDLKHIPQVRALNKMDLIEPSQLDDMRGRLDGVAISAKNKATLPPLIEKLSGLVESLTAPDSGPVSGL